MHHGLYRFAMFIEREGSLSRDIIKDNKALVEKSNIE